MRSPSAAACIFEILVITILLFFRLVFWVFAVSIGLERLFVVLVFRVYLFLFFCFILIWFDGVRVLAGEWVVLLMMEVCLDDDLDGGIRFWVIYARLVFLLLCAFAGYYI